MLKRITKLLNKKLLLQREQRLLTAKQGDDNVAQVTQQLVKDGQQQATQILQNPTPVQGQAVQLQAVQQQIAKQFDSFQYSTLIDSNWKQMASLIHTSFSFNKKNPQYLQQINKKLNEIQSLYDFDLNKLDRLKILDQRQFDIKSTIYSISNDHTRYLSHNIGQNSQIGYRMMTNKKVKDMIQNQSIAAIVQTYKNGEFKQVTINNQLIMKITQSVISTNFQTQYFLNLFEIYKLTEKDNMKRLSSNKNIQKILQNLHNFHDVNKLKFYWALNNVYENGMQLLNYQGMISELTKVGFVGLQEEKTQKNLKFIYNSILGRNSLKKLINLTINKYSSNFDQFLQFWGLFNLLITKLNALNQTSLINPSSLNEIFNLFELNLSQPKEAIAKFIPQIIYQTKNKSLFQIYRTHAKFWMDKKVDNTHKNVTNGPFDQFINNKIEFEQTIKVDYNGWKSQKAATTQVNIRTSNSNNLKNAQKKDSILSQTKMIQHLIQGDYNFVLNHFLLVFTPGLDKTNFNELKKIIQNAKDLQFDSQNTKSLYILKNINQQFKHLADPIDFRKQFLGNYKKIKWLERSNQRQTQKQTKYSHTYKPRRNQRNQRDNIQYQSEIKQFEDIDKEEIFGVQSKERIRSKPQRPQGSLFSKKNKNLFSTQKDSYSEYRQVVREVTQTSPQFGFNFSTINPDIQFFKKEVQKRSKEMNQTNHKAILKQINLPIVGNGINLMKYLFLKKSQHQQIKVDQKLKKRLRVNFISQIGALQKDYSEYLLHNRFNFALAQQVYVSLLTDQTTNYNRKTFKTIVTHMIAFRSSMTKTQIQIICQICNKNKIGITLIEIYHLIIQNKIVIEKQSIYKFCDTLQKFKKINNDIFLLTKKYCQNIKIQFQIKFMTSYVKNLLIEEDDNKLNQLCQMIKNQLKLKPYKVRTNLTAEENLKLEKQYKELQKKQYHRILFEIIDMVVLNANHKLPQFISTLFDQYEKSKLKLDAKQIAISLIVYCNNVDKFLQIIRTLKANPENIIIDTFQCAIKAARLNPRGLESHSEEIFNVSLFTHNFILTEELINKTVQIFKILNTPTVFIKFLEYILRHNPPVTYENKSSMYFIMNNINDDFAKNTISGLLDFIFNANRQKQRQEYRKSQILQEQKAKLIKDLDKKEFIIEDQQIQTQDQKSAKKQDNKEAKKGKKSKNEKNQKDKPAADIKTAQKGTTKATSTSNEPVKQKTPKTQRRKISLKTEQDFLLQDNDPVLKKTNLKKKYRSKSINNFEQMFTKKQQAQQEVIKGGKITKGAKNAQNNQKQPQKTQKKPQKKK